MTRPRFVSHVTARPTRTLTPWDEAQLLVGLARKRVDQGQMRMALSRASAHARAIAEKELHALGYAEALTPIEVPDVG